MNMVSHQPVPQPDSSIRHDAELVAHLRTSEVFRDYQMAFQTATGLPLVLRSPDTFDRPLEGSKQVNAFCALIGGSSKACAACLGLQQRVAQERPSEVMTLRCFAGLSESVVPIRLGERVVAYLQTGQVLFRAPSLRDFKAVMTELEKWHAQIDVKALQAAFFETRVLPKARYGAVLRLLASFAQHLSMLSNELMIQQSAGEPKAVERARTFIQEHLGEPLSLPQVARAANTSTFYFCKVFKRSTGLTFTDYLARARVEKTKQLLLNPHVRVSEAAYEAGFQSLSQFNRAFRRVTGESPSVHREHLPGAVGRSTAIAA
jgi:AraC-like DNA-binding protein/ligand-binding sensor protein